MIVFTICSNNYLSQALTLGHSLLQYNPNYKFIIGLVDRKNDAIDYNKIPFEIIEVEKIGISYFDEMITKYEITELNTAVKPCYFHYFFNSLNTESVIYLDPDIEVFAPFDELEKELISNDIILTPHTTTPLNDDKSPTEENFLNAGIYNLGFIAIKNTANGNKMINWWADRLRHKAYNDFSRGLFTDQIWINFVPLFFEKVKIFTHVGYNVAYWNLHERTLLHKSEMYYVNNEKQRLVFYHFSGYSPLNQTVLSVYQDRFSFEEREDLKSLFKNYTAKLFENKYVEFKKITCFFVINKKKMDTEQYTNYKKSIPIYKKIIRGVILRFIKLFKINIDYYVH